MTGRGVLITGASGFLGQALVERFWTAGWKVYGASSSTVADPPYIPLWAASEDPAGVEPPADLGAVVIASGPGPNMDADGAGARHLDGIRQILAWARHHQVQRLVYVSVLAASQDGLHPLRRVKAHGEDLVQHSGLAWTVVRPSLLFGHGSGFFQRLEEWASRPVSFVPSSPAVTQPVFVSDVAEAILRAVGSPSTVGRVFECPGPHLVTMRDLIRQMAADSVWWQRRVLAVDPQGRFARMVRWPWTTAEWSYYETEPRVRDSHWLLDLGILPRSLSMFYAPFGRG